MKTINQNSEQYQFAKNKVKKLKEFYSHLFIYLIINIMIIFGRFYDQPFTIDNFWTFGTFSTAIFWGIGLIAHGASVFLNDMIFGGNWEKRKLEEFMTKDKNSNWE